MNETTISGVHVASRDPSTLWDLHINQGCIDKIIPHSSFDSPPATSTLALPSLCHPHVHLDKPFLLSSTLPQYAPFIPKTGGFNEALQLTGAAKSQFTKDDMFQRGQWLIVESARAGVTHMRAFVEVDKGVGTLGIDVAKELKQKWKDVLHLQICAFAQDPIFTGDEAEKNRKLMEDVLRSDNSVDVLGTTPYVEGSKSQAIRNVEWAIELAIDRKLGLDFHLDYNLNADETGKGAILDQVIKLLGENKWSERSDKTICIGHCTRATTFSEAELETLAKEIRQKKLLLYLVGLPASDLYMMGRPEDGAIYQQTRPRGTLQIPDLIKTHGMNAAIGINNVGNAFTPWGNCDPLSLASLGVGLYHAGTPADARLLYECVSTRAKTAIGVATTSSAELKEDASAGILLVESGQEMSLGGLTIKCRSLRTVEEVVWSPPPLDKRRLISNGREILTG